MKPCNRLTAEYSNTRGFSFIFNKEFSNRKGKRTHGRRSRGFPVQDWAKRKFAVLRGRSDKENRTPWTRSGILRRFWWRNTPDHVPPVRSSARIQKKLAESFSKRWVYTPLKLKKSPFSGEKNIPEKKRNLPPVGNFLIPFPETEHSLFMLYPLKGLPALLYDKVDDV